MTEDTRPGPHGPMRRKDREIADRAAIDAVLADETVMHLALSDENVPFVVPVFFAYDGAALYFHSAPAGTKIDILRRNDRVCFSVTAGVGVIEDEQACDFEARHRTVIGSGRARFVEDPAEKARILDLIVGRFTDRAFTYPPNRLAQTAVVRVEVEQIKGKSHGFPKG